MVRTKICGVKTAEAMRAAADGGASLVGLVSFAPSPRHLGIDAMTALVRETGRPLPVAVLTVDAGDAELDAIMQAVRPDYLQLHGSETIDRARAVRDRTGARIIKALGVSSTEDLAEVAGWDLAVDHLLFDARPPKGADRPGGLGHTFDWNLLSGLRLTRPWFLAGGLTPENVGQAIVRTGAPMVDVSSGVESVAGVKDIGLIQAFLDHVNSVSPRQ